MKPVYVTIEYTENRIFCESSSVCFVEPCFLALFQKSQANLTLRFLGKFIEWYNVQMKGEKY